MRRVVSLTLSLFAVAALGVATVGCKSGAGGGGSTVEPKTEEQKTFYALGLWSARQMATFNLKPEELELVTQGLRDGVLNKKPLVDINTFGPKLNELAQARAKLKVEEEKKQAGPFLEAAAKETGAEKTASGLVYLAMTQGSGESPTDTDKVTVQYKGTLRDGTVFDSSYERKAPASFGLKGVIPCWTEGVQKMKVGGKAKLTCPSTIAYGDRGQPPKIPPGAVLTFEIELVSIEHPAATPPGGPTGAPMTGMPPHPVGTPITGMPPHPVGTPAPATKK